MLRTCIIWNPGSTSRSRRKLCNSNPALTSKTTVRPYSEITAIDIHLRWRLLCVPVRPPSRSVLAMSSRDISNAGASAKTRGVRQQTANVKINAEKSILISSRRGISTGVIVTRTGVMRVANANPISPADRASSRPSVRTWRTTSARLAPSAHRTANSRLRSTDLASRRFATLAHPISSTTPIALSSTSNPT